MDRRRNPTKGLALMMLRSRLRCVLAVGSVAAFALVPSTAQAGLLAADATNCEEQAFAQVFLPWADPANYTLHPGGDFEPGSPAWDHTSGAAEAAVNEPWDVTDDLDGHSLALGSGSSATSPTICVGIEHPDIRFFAKASSSLATLKVEVLFTDGNGNTQTLAIGSATGNSGWAPTAPMPIVANLLPLLPGSKTPVAFRLTATSGSWKVDDFYVDPYARW
jgi:hypothetical protein